jgi:hypothetical protein
MICPQHDRYVAGLQSAGRVLERIDELITFGERIAKDTLSRDRVPAQEYAEWRLECSSALARLFGAGSDLARAFLHPDKDPVVSGGGVATGPIPGLRHEHWHVLRMVGVLRAAKKRLSDDPLFSLRRPILAGFLISVVEGAKELLELGQKDAAAMFGRVALECELKERTGEAGVPIKKDKPTLSDFNDALLTAGVLKKHEWLQIKSYADIGNAAAHGKFDEYTEKEVGAMLQWIGDFTAGEEGGR